MVGRSRHLWTPEPEEMDGDDVVMRDEYDQRSFPQYANSYQEASVSQQQWAASQQPSGSLWGGVWQDKERTQRDKRHNEVEETAAKCRQYEAEKSLAVQHAWRDLEQTAQDSVLNAKLAKEALKKQLKESELAKKVLQQQVMESEQRARAAKENLERIAQQALEAQDRFEAATLQQAHPAQQQAHPAQQQFRQNTTKLDINSNNEQQPFEHVEYSQLVLPRVIRLNFQKSKIVEDIWQFVHLFVDDLDRLNPRYDFTRQQYEEIWAYCVRGCSRSGEFLLTLGFVDNLNDARAIIEDGAQSIKQTKALMNAIKKKNKFTGGRGQAGRNSSQAPPKKDKQFFDPPTGPKADRQAPKAGNAPRATAWNKEGSIVGHSAKEIGADNKGRAMLEKMGWSAGMGLGMENSGILAPVPVVVKHSTLGLGMDSQQARRNNTWAKTQR